MAAQRVTDSDVFNFLFSIILLEKIQPRQWECAPQV
jgi:hypothetical protein